MELRAVIRLDEQSASILSWPKLKQRLSTFDDKQTKELVNEGILLVIQCMYDMMF